MGRHGSLVLSAAFYGGGDTRNLVVTMAQNEV